MIQNPMEDVRYRDRVQDLAAEDAKKVLEKDETYGASWKRRGGVGAFMMMARKFDRIETEAQRHGFDIFNAACISFADGDSVLNDISDLRRYLLLIEAEMRVRLGDVLT